MYLFLKTPRLVVYTPSPKNFFLLFPLIFLFFYYFNHKLHGKYFPLARLVGLINIMVLIIQGFLHSTHGLYCNVESELLSICASGSDPCSKVLTEILKLLKPRISQGMQRYKINALCLFKCMFTTKL